MRHRPRSSRRLIGLMFVVTLAPSILLVTLGWRLFRADRDGELRALQERRTQAAERVASALARRLEQVEERLVRADLSQAFPEIDRHPDAAVFAAIGDTNTVVTRDGLAYRPLVRTPTFDHQEAFTTGEALEYRHADPRAAAAWFRDLARTASSLRAGALLHLARNLRKQNAIEAALETYAVVSGLPPSLVEGVPSDLRARWSRCDLLAAAGRSEDLEREASALLLDLRRGRWTLARDVYEMQVTDAARWAGMPLPLTPTPREVLTNALDTALRRSPSAQSDAAGNHRELVETSDGFGAALVRVQSSGLVVFAALPSYVEREWLAPERKGLEGQNMQVALRNPARRSNDPAAALVHKEQSDLPWTVAVTSPFAEAELALLSGRRRLWWSALAALAVLIVAGTALAVRALASELAMARLQSEFVSAVSHEFRTPLTSLRQISEVLQEARVSTEDRRQDYYAALVRQTNRLQRLVEALLDFGRMEAGAAHYRREPLALDHLVKAVVAEFLDEAASPDAPAQIHVTTTPTGVTGDAAALSNAIRNLIDNAVKYSSETRAVWVDVRTVDGAAAVRVRDRGMGIPIHEQREIFRKFTRGARATSERISGTGIGLAIVDHVVHAHGGKVTLQSEPGIGSTFTMWLPISNRAAEFRSATDERDPAASSSGRDVLS